MSSEGRDGNATPAAPVYTVYPVPGGNAGNLNYGFYQNDPNAPPPKYEEVVGGIPGVPISSPGPGRIYNEQEQPDVIFVAPLYKPSQLQRTLGVIFGILFLIAFITIVAKNILEKKLNDSDVTDSREPNDEDEDLNEEDVQMDSTSSEESVEVMENEKWYNSPNSDKI